MKKILLALLIFGAIACAPIAKADAAPTDTTIQTQTDAQLRAQLISLIQQLITILQQQLATMTAGTTTTDPNQTITVQGIPTFDFTPIAQNDGTHMIILMPQMFDRCNLTITDTNGRVVRNQDTWNKGQDGNWRQVYEPSTPDQHTYSITCTQAGFEPTTKTGNFPAAQ